MIDWLKFPWLDLFLFIEHYSLADSFLSSFLSATNQIHNTTTKMLKNQNRNDKILKNDICNSCSSKQNWAQFNLIKRFTGFISIFQYIFKKKRSPAFAEWQVSKISGKNPSIELVDDTQLNRTMVM